MQISTTPRIWHLFDASIRKRNIVKLKISERANGALLHGFGDQVSLYREALVGRIDAGKLHRRVRKIGKHRGTQQLDRKPLFACRITCMCELPREKMANVVWNREWQNTCNGLFLETRTQNAGTVVFQHRAPTHFWKLLSILFQYLYQHIPSFFQNFNHETQVYTLWAINWQYNDFLS